MRGCFVFVLVLLIATFQTGALAQTGDGKAANLVDWYYGAVYGTGIYRVGDKTVAQFRVPISYTLKSVPGRRWNVRLLFPVSVGLYDFDLSSILEGDITEKVGTIALLPGAEVLVPAGERWMLKPFAHVGGGWEFSSSGRALIFAAGVRSRTSWIKKRTEHIVGGEIQFAGYRTSEDLTSTLSRFGVGGKIVAPLGATMSGRELNLGVHVVYYHYFNDFESFIPARTRVETVEIADEVEFAVTVGSYRPVDILGFELERIGVGVVIGEDLLGIRLVSTFPF